MHAAFPPFLLYVRLRLKICINRADDKSIRVWEFGVPVQAKCLADPSMHAISSAATSPSGKWWLGQSADNRIVTYSASESVRHNKKKTFGGHSSAGYACQIGVSHDGQYVYSGDGEGKVFIWSWKTKKVRVCALMRPV